MTDAAASEPITEIWICVGARVGVSGKRVVGWIQANGQTIYFVDRGSYITGGKYQVHVTRAPDGSFKNYRAMQYAGNRETDTELLGQWRAEEVAAEAALSAKAAERKHKGEDPLDKLLEPLVKHAKTLRKGADRDALAAYIIRRVAKGADW